MHLFLQIEFKNENKWANKKKTKKKIDIHMLLYVQYVNYNTVEESSKEQTYFQ